MIVLHQDKISASSGFKGDPGQVTAAQGNSRVQVRFIVEKWGISDQRYTFSCCINQQ
jgi:hypothetical protein